MVYCQHAEKHGGWQKRQIRQRKCGYRFKLIFGPETLKMGFKATIVWVKETMKNVKEMSKTIGNYKPILQEDKEDLEG